MSKRNVDARKRARDLNSRADADYARRSARQAVDYSIYECWAQALRECEYGNYYISDMAAARIFGVRLGEAAVRGLVRHAPGAAWLVAKPHCVVQVGAA